MAKPKLFAKAKPQDNVTRAGPAAASHTLIGAIFVGGISMGGCV
jgi:hypothetical protein